MYSNLFCFTYVRHINFLCRTWVYSTFIITRCNNGWGILFCSGFAYPVLSGWNILVVWFSWIMEVNNSEGRIIMQMNEFWARELLAVHLPKHLLMMPVSSWTSNTMRTWINKRRKRRCLGALKWMNIKVEWFPICWTCTIENWLYYFPSFPVDALTTLGDYWRSLQSS